MNSLHILTIGTLIALGLACRYFYLDYAREAWRNERLRKRNEELIDQIEYDVLVITELRRQLAQQRHPAGKAARTFRVIKGGAS